MKQNYFPGILNVTDRDCLVIGSDAEATQKADRLKKSGAKVRLVSKDDFKLDEIENQFLVMFSDYKDSQTAEKIYNRCREKKVLFCAIDQPDFCDVVNVSLAEKGPLRVMISTSGVSPALGKKIREALEVGWKDIPLEDFLTHLSRLRSDPNRTREKLIGAVKDVNVNFKITLPESWKP